MKRFLLSAALLLACSGVALAQESEFSGGGGGGITAAPGSGTAGRVPQFASATSVVDSKMTTSGTNSGTWTLRDSTAVTGDTSLVIRGGPGQALSYLDIKNNAGTSVFEVQYAFSILSLGGGSLVIDPASYMTLPASFDIRATSFVPFTITNPVLQWPGGTNTAGLQYDGAAGALGIRSGTNSQSLRLYNTYTDASNYHRIQLEYASGVQAWDLLPSDAGTGAGTQNNLRIRNFGSIYAPVQNISLGYAYPLVISTGFPPNTYIYPGADVMDLGGPSNQFVDFYNGKSYQGGRSKTLSDAGDIGFVRIAVPTADTMVAGHINYTIASLDSSGHAVEGQSGTVYFAIRNQNGTVTATPDGTGNVADVKKDLGSIGTCTFKSSIATTNCDFVVNADTTLTFTGFTITWTVVITSGNAVVTAL